MPNTFRTITQQGAEANASGTKLAYPSDIISNHGYFMEVCALKHIFGDASRNGRGVEVGRHSIASVYLPIPVNFTEGKQEHSYDTKASVGGTLLNTLGPVARSVAQAANVGGLVSTIAGTVGSSYNSLAALNQSVFNPGYYVAYQRPEYRQHEFAWAFAPRNRSDSEIVANITRWLKFFSSPAKQNLQPNFLYPNEFRVRFMFSEDGTNAVDIFEPRLQTGYIASIEVNHFNESGNPVGFFTGTKYPALTTLSFLFIENELVYKDDFADLQVFDEMTQQTTLPNFESTSNPSG